MSAVMFDTLEFVNSLQESGFNEEQAKGMAGAIKKVRQAQLETLATKGDLLELKGELKADIAEIKTDIAEIKGEIRLNRWMLVLIIAVTVLPSLKSLFGF